MTINGKSYTVPVFNFGTATKLERMGISVGNMREAPLSLIVGWVALAMGVGFDEAAEALDKHVEAGGDTVEISKEITESFKSSSFFKRGETQMDG